ncbi:MAG: winged helix-turn-helix transcriptional regulator [Thermoplasmata archaeon]|nr:winged helix-turn-helix transcriptional regulator [Thermoplasmata archaeon]
MAISFTSAEQSVLYGLVKYPRLNDRELSEIIGVKPSTTTAIRRRLRKKDVFCTKRIPMGHMLGHEIMAVAYGKIRPTLKEKDREEFLSWVRDIPYVFLSLACSDAVLNIAYLKNYSMYRKYTDFVSERFRDTELVDAKTWIPVIFGFQSSKPVTYFDFAPAVRHAFGIEDEEYEEPTFEKPSGEKLTKKEKSVLKGLVMYPESSDKDIAEKIDASRQAVSTMKRRFEDAGLMKTVRIVDLQKIGYSILAVAHSAFTPYATMESRESGMKVVRESIPAVLNIASNPENVMLAPVMDYDEFHRLRTQAVRYYMDKGFMTEEPRVTLFPLSDTLINKNYDFSGFMDIVVGEDE